MYWSNFKRSNRGAGVVLTSIWNFSAVKQPPRSPAF
jgi:hypothetical protein